jgi:PST family polysaccharide transporter
LRGDAAWQLLERGVRLLLGFSLSLLIARQLGPDGFGIYSFALSLVALFAFLGQAGLEAILVRQLVHDPEDTAATLSSSIALRLVGATLGAAAAIVLAFMTSTEALSPAPLLVMILSISGLMQAGWVIEPWLQVNNEFRRAASAKIIAYVAAAGLRFAALLTEEPLFYLAMASVVESALCTVLLWMAAVQRRGGGPGKLHRPEAGHMRRMAVLVTPMILSAMTVALYSRIDVFMLGVLIGPSAAGLYSAATLLSEGFYLLPTAIMAAAAPRLARLYVADSGSFLNALSRLVTLLSGGGLVVVALTLATSSLAISILFGPDYSDAGAILRIHIWSTWMVFVSTACDSWYINKDLRRLYLAKTACAAALNIVLNLLLIPRWQGEGAALATVIAYAFSAIGFNLLNSRTRPLFGLQMKAMFWPRSHPAPMESDR